MRRLGFPKTDEEREQTHQYLYGETELPIRGTGLTPVFTPNKITIVSATTAALTGMGGYALTQGLRQEKVSWGSLIIAGLGSGCIAGLTSFLVTRYITSD